MFDGVRGDDPEVPVFEDKVFVVTEQEGDIIGSFFVEEVIEAWVFLDFVENLEGCVDGRGRGRWDCVGGVGEVFMEGAVAD